jgi:hypothetical protein
MHTSWLHELINLHDVSSSIHVFTKNTQTCALIALQYHLSISGDCELPLRKSLNPLFLTKIRRDGLPCRHAEEDCGETIYRNPASSFTQSAVLYYMLTFLDGYHHDDIVAQHNHQSNLEPDINIPNSFIREAAFEFPRSSRRYNRWYSSWNYTCSCCCIHTLALLS